jgi:CRP-like cAMP-binding protein
MPRAAARRALKDRNGQVQQDGYSKSTHPARLSSMPPVGCHNQLLMSFPPGVLERLKPHLQVVFLEKNDVLFRAQETLRTVYFPQTAVISLVSRLESGEALEVGLVGGDGMAGIAVFPGITTMSCDGVVQVAGWSFRMSADVLRRELRSDEALCSNIGRYAQVLLARSMRMSVCNMFHSVEQRCIRWLLTISDLTNHFDMPLTHDLIATMLGVHRPTVTLVLGTLRRAGLISETRGRVVIRDRRGLETACCECYRAMRDEQARLLGY